MRYFSIVLYQMGMIPHYKEEWTSEDVAKGLQDYLICIEMFLAAIVHVFVFPHTDYLKSSWKKFSIVHAMDFNKEDHNPDDPIGRFNFNV
jgi:hypothetical protein